MAGDVIPEVIAEVIAVDEPRPPPVRVGVVGLGYWGPNLVRNLEECDRAELVAICDKREESLAKISRRFPAARTTTELTSLLADDEIEAIAIATPVSTHYAIASAALRAGKHVFVEKPLAGSVVGAQVLVDLAGAEKRVLMPGHTFVYSPPVNYVRDIVQGGELGEIYFISMSRVNLGLHQPDASVTWDLAPHDFSILRHWLGDTPRYVTATARSCVIPTIPDVAFIALEYDSGIIANVELAWLAPSKLRRTTIIGSRKMLLYDDTSNEPVRIFDSGVNLMDPATFGEWQMTYRTGDIVSPFVLTAEPLLLEMTDFCDAIRLGRQPESSAEFGLDIVRMLEGVDRSLAKDGARIDLVAERNALTEERSMAR